MKDPQRGIAEWQRARRGPRRQVGRVRALPRAPRRPIADPHPYGRPSLDTHMPASSRRGLYHADGQILGEVYE